MRVDILNHSEVAAGCESLWIGRTHGAVPWWRDAWEEVPWLLVDIGGAGGGGGWSAKCVKRGVGAAATRAQLGGHAVMAVAMLGAVVMLLTVTMLSVAMLLAAVILATVPMLTACMWSITWRMDATMRVVLTSRTVANRGVMLAVMLGLVPAMCGIAPPLPMRTRVRIAEVILA